MCIVERFGPAVTLIEQGDRVVMPFNVACGFCRNCKAGYTAFCTTVNPGFAGGAYGYVAIGAFRGRPGGVSAGPYADFNCLELPPGSEPEADFALLADVAIMAESSQAWLRERRWLSSVRAQSV